MTVVAMAVVAMTVVAMTVIVMVVIVVAITSAATRSADARLPRRASSASPRIDAQRMGGDDVELEVTSP